MATLTQDQLAIRRQMIKQGLQKVIAELSPIVSALDTGSPMWQEDAVTLNEIILKLERIMDGLAMPTPEIRG